MHLWCEQRAAHHKETKHVVFCDDHLVACEQDNRHVPTTRANIAIVRSTALTRGTVTRLRHEVSSTGVRLTRLG